MTNSLAKHARVGGAIAALLCVAAPVLGQEAPVEGVFALQGAAQTVTGKLDVEATGPLSRKIVLTYADRTTGEQIAGFDVELTQQLHILAVDAELTHLIHEHADEVGADGSFTAELAFPAPGVYHIYTDAVPTGLGQQVMRFDVSVGDEAATDTPKPPTIDITTGPVVSSDGPYTVTLDASQLQAGVESEVSLVVDKDGTPAGDLEPYLGVSAHAVFIRAEDLAYVHAHATEAGAEEGHHAHGAEPATSQAADTGDHHHDMGTHNAGSNTDGSAAMHGAEHGGHGVSPAPESGQDAHEAASATPIDPEMALHVTPPGAGTYALWIEFIGGGEIHTVPFTIKIPEASSHASH